MKKVVLFPFILLSVSVSADDMPDWVLNPYAEGYSFCACGYAPENSSIQLQKKIARINASSEISKMITVDINTEINTDKKVSSVDNTVTDISSQASSSSRHKSSGVINGAQELDSWTDKKTGEYYALICIK